MKKEIKKYVMTLAKLCPLSKCSPKYILKVILIIVSISAQSLNFFLLYRCSACCLKVKGCTPLNSMASQFFKRILFIYFQREEKGGRETSMARDTWIGHLLVASRMPPTGDLAHNPGMCPDWESNQQPFGSQTGTQSTKPQQPGIWHLNFKNWIHSLNCRPKSVYVTVCKLNLIFKIRKKQSQIIHNPMVVGPGHGCVFQKLSR